MIERMWGHLKRIPIRGHLNSPKEFLSPLSLVLIAGIWMPISYLVIFNASWKELAIGLLVDRISVILIIGLVFKEFYSRYPIYKSLVEGTELNAPIDEKFILELQKFPHRFALQCLIGGLLKNIPVGIYVIASWNHGFSFKSALACFFLLTIISMIHGYGCQFIELHNWSTNYLKAQSQKIDLREVFKSTLITSARGDFFWAEVSSYLTIILSLLACLGIRFSNQSQFSLVDSIQYFVITISALILLTREFYLSRTFFFEGLTQIFNAMNDRTFFNEHKELPLHSSALLAKFEQVFNKMNSDLRYKVNEVKQWTNYATAKTRMQTLGETSTIITHDLASPIHSMKLFIEELKENPDEVARSAEMIERMNFALGRCEELIQSFRASLKNPYDQTRREATSVRELYSYAANSVLTLIRTSEDIAIGIVQQPQMSLIIDSPESVRDVLLNISRLDGIHIMTNLLKNAAEELMRSQVPNPFISVRLRGINSEMVEIRIIDNGRGLTPSDFEAFTSDNGLFKGHFASVGLHLIRKMIESRGGSMSVEVPQSDGLTQGTAVVIKLAGSMINEESKREENYLDS